MAKNVKKMKPEKVDGMSPKDVQKIRNAVRQIWQRSSHARKLVVKRSTGPDGFPICEKCKKTVPKITVDHIIPVGDLLNGGIERMFTSSDKLQALCPPCHKAKTKIDNKKTKAKKSKKTTDDFF